MSFEKLKPDDLLALAEYAANQYVPESLKVTISAAFGLPTASSMVIRKQL